MRHPYVGDVGDFGKYGLLRVLAGDGDALRLGVVWYLTDAAEHNNDGKHDGYLKGSSDRIREAFRCCDPSLYAQMAKIRARQRLNIEMVQDGSVLPKNSIFYATPVPAFRDRLTACASLSTRWEQRQAWHSEAVRRTTKACCVFVDPDNGAKFASQEETRRRTPSHKHAYWREIAEYLARRQSVVAYHHLGRQRGGHHTQILKCLAVIRSRGRTAWAVHYRRGTARAFLIIPAEDHRQVLCERSQQYLDTWKLHASLVAG